MQSLLPSQTSLLLFGGGGPHGGKVELYNPFNPSLNRYLDLECHLTAHVGGLIGQNVLMAGGERPDSRTFLSDTFVYPLNGEVPSTAPSLPNTRAGCAWATVQDRLFLFSGVTNVNDTVALTDSCLSFGPTWTSIASIPAALRAAPAAAINMDIFIVGGDLSWPGEPAACTNRVQMYKSDVDCWVQRPAMLQNRAGLGVAADHNCVVVAGGRGNDGKTLCSAEFLDIRTDAWAKLPDVQLERCYHRMVICRGKVLAIAGKKSMKAGDFLGPQVEMLDWVANKWVRVEDVLCERSGFVPVVI